MFKKWLIVGTVVVVLLTSVLLAGCQGSTATTVSTSQQTGIWVSGEGKVSVTPDIANVQLGISAQAKTMLEAQNQAADAMDKVMAALTTNGIDKKDIVTSYFNAQPITQWNQNTQKQETTGFQVTNLVTVKIRNVGITGLLIDAVITAGGDLTQVNSINFAVNDPSSYYSQARTIAISSLKSKAENIATLTGVKLGKLVYVTESSSSPIVPIYYDKVTASAGSGTSISAGQIDITLTVQAVYAIN